MLSFMRTFVISHKDIIMENYGTKIKEKTITTCISYDENLQYPIMYIED